MPSSPQRGRPGLTGAAGRTAYGFMCVVSRRMPVCRVCVCCASARWDVRGECVRCEIYRARVCSFTFACRCVRVRAVERERASRQIVFRRCRRSIYIPRLRHSICRVHTACCTHSISCSRRLAQSHKRGGTSVASLRSWLWRHAAAQATRTVHSEGTRTPRLPSSTCTRPTQTAWPHSGALRSEGVAFSPRR